MNKNNFDLDELKGLWDRQSEALEGHRLISDEEIARVVRQDAEKERKGKAWWPRVAAAVAVMLVAGGAALWLTQGGEETMRPTEGTTAWVEPRKEVTLPAVREDEVREALEENTLAVLPTEKKRATEQKQVSPTLVERVAEEIAPEATRVPPEWVAEAEMPERPKIPNTVETTRLVCVTGDCKEREVAVVEREGLIETIEPEPERPTFHNSVIEPIIEWLGA